MTKLAFQNGNEICCLVLPLPSLPPCPEIPQTELMLELLEWENHLRHAKKEGEEGNTRAEGTKPKDYLRLPSMCVSHKRNLVIYTNLQETET